jgi:hypothetical protein
MLIWLTIALGGVCTEFSDDFAPSAWVDTESDGSASVDLGASSTSQVVFDYSRGTFFGVSSTTFSYSVTVPDTGVVHFDWNHDFDHGGWDIESELFVDSSSGTDTLHQLFGSGGNPSGSFNASGSHSVAVTAGSTLTLRVRGANDDWFSGIDGTVTLSNLAYDAPICACDGVWYGSAYEDACGSCDDNPANDCVVDCEGTPGGTATLDMCGTCDADPVNDCVQDCHGDWGGSATTDSCGTCVGGNTGLEPCDPTTGATGDTGSTTTTDTGPTTTTDTGPPAETAAPDTGTGAGVQIVEPGAAAADGCGCATTSSRRPWWWAFARREPSQASGA